MQCVCAAAVMVRFDRSVRHETCEAGAVELVRRVSRCHGPGHNSASGDRWHTWSGDTWLRLWLDVGPKTKSLI